MPSILLLPERRRFAGQDISPAIARRLGRADRSTDGAPGERAQLERYFRVASGDWPMAAIQREYDAGDAEGSAWLRADPVYCRPDMTGVRLLAWGNLDIDDDTSGRFLTSLQPIFEDAGMAMSMTAPDRWFLRLPVQARLPAFAAPEQVLGADLFEHMPQGEAGRRWRTLLSEAQIVLHNHPANAERASRGQWPVNSLWFWGGGTLPETVATSAAAVESTEPELLALFARAQASTNGPGIVDLRHVRDWRMVERRIETHAELVLDFADGGAWHLAPGHRWRVWRLPKSDIAND